jgi:hypothetical protein|tara:strand:- start:2088 stop:2960 length:873 start_codon:yes stop_codon:yes gene_type:complete
MVGDWVMNLPLLIGSISQQASAGGGGGAVTQEANLDHWWKFPSPGEASPPTSVLDVGTSSATRINIDAANIAISSSARTLGSNTFDAYDLNGSNARAYEKLLSNPTTLHPLDTFSFCAWVNYDAIASYKVLLTSGVTNGGWDDGYFIYTYAESGELIDGAGPGHNIPTNTLVWGSSGWKNSGATGASVAYATLPSAGTWFHVAAVIDVSSNVQKLYINGSAGQDAVVTVVAPNAIYPLNYYMSIGGATWGLVDTTNTNYFTDGKVSDVRIYSVALSASEVSAIYAGDWSP